ncbi:hypothetical protein AVEN_44225-1 [Araneus ventricosus]|uniref:Uncharacterized protein n=1 Tax=Araneus ventricosus TaxID=182803 RepID=A0A4Y2N789_ARAVE|nr:hypothetical protein AVEN_44225-1 [Araneus ventricosus]
MEERLLRPHQRSSAFGHSDTECIQTYAAAETVSSHFTVHSSCPLGVAVQCNIVRQINTGNTRLFHMYSMVLTRWECQSYVAYRKNSRIAQWSNSCKVTPHAI